MHILKFFGGVKLDEPAIDLAVLTSIVSSFKDQAVRATDCFIGEVGLTGEVRRVSRIEQRVIEAAKLGFKELSFLLRILVVGNFRRN